MVIPVPNLRQVEQTQPKNHYKNKSLLFLGCQHSYKGPTPGAFKFLEHFLISKAFSEMIPTLTL